jgi:hypothetical protein
VTVVRVVVVVVALVLVAVVVVIVGTTGGLVVVNVLVVDVAVTVVFIVYVGGCFVGVVPQEGHGGSNDHCNSHPFPIGDEYDVGTSHSTTTALVGTPSTYPIWGFFP